MVVSLQLRNIKPMKRSEVNSRQLAGNTGGQTTDTLTLNKGKMGE